MKKLCLTISILLLLIPTISAAASLTGIGNIVCVTDLPYGAKGDGITNDTMAIRSAIDSLAETGGVVYFPRGIYLITPNHLIITKKGIVLQGENQSFPTRGDAFGTTIKSASGTGDMIVFEGSGVSPAESLMNCQINDMLIHGSDQKVQGLTLRWCAGFRLNNVAVFAALKHGVYIEQLWDSSFTNLEVLWCGSQPDKKAGVYICNGSGDNSNNLRFFAPHFENNYGNDVWIDASGKVTDNHSILFDGGKCEKNQLKGNYSTKAFHFTGFNGYTGHLNINITIRNMCISQYMNPGDIGIHWTGGGYMSVQGCFFVNNKSGGTGIKIEGPSLGNYTHRISDNVFTSAGQEILIADTFPRKYVWISGNRRSGWNITDNRIDINGTLTMDWANIQ